MARHFCTIHDVALDDGPVRYQGSLIYRCSHGHSIYAADLDLEYVPRTPVIQPALFELVTR